MVAYECGAVALIDGQTKGVDIVPFCLFTIPKLGSGVSLSVWCNT